MEKYLGNKTSLLPVIDAFFQIRIPDAKSVADLFSGTTNVSRYFRARGWHTAACDTNRFTYVMAQAYLGTTQPPKFAGLPLGPIEAIRMDRIGVEFERANSRFGALYLPGLNIRDAFSDLEQLARVLALLQSIGETNNTAGVFTKYYSGQGKQARFLSLRGTTGFRNYFSPGNALFLDGVLAAIRMWWLGGAISKDEVFLLLASVLEEVTITANVNGTFHDFNRNRLWPNAEQPFFLRVPLISCRGSAAEYANADVLKAASAFGHYDVCYLDPPYNFRQYSAYYHLLNFISAYPFLSEIDEYVTRIAHVRGQHPDDDFSSDFCFRDRFVTSLKSLIGSVNANHIVLSYYGGRNHWNHWSRVDTPTDEGLHEIRSVFEDGALFSSCEIVPALEIRKNYQSRGGAQKGLINEYLFHGIRRPRRRRAAALPPPSLTANEYLGISDAFQHVLHSRTTPIRLKRKAG